MANPKELILNLKDVVPEIDDKGEAEPIKIKLEYEKDSPFGIVLTPLPTEYDEYRIVVENHHGKLMCHIWSTTASIGNDPTHSIEIERSNK